jgi:hypothetical protein|tara:strand:+ start:6962 stop:7225 length:264 start_codon:yes stop_codon:yes gene_type:complete
MATREEILDSNEAELILNSDTLKKSIENLKQEYVALWLNSKGEDNIAFRETLHTAINILPEVERHLRILVERGKITSAQVKKLHNYI